MTTEFKARVVIRLSEAFASAVNTHGLPYATDSGLAPLKAALASEKAELHNQLRDFEYYVQSSEAHGINDTPMVNWTRDASSHPYAQAKYSRLFAIAVAGKKVFEMDEAQRIAGTFQPLVDAGVIEAVKVDSMDPSKNPPVPKQYFK